MSSEEQFRAAVNVIRNLPTDAKNAPFQPSDTLKLKFYAYFKQATEGPNNTPKPSFYDLVGKYKWTAWKDLGDMSKQDAMKGYVCELKKIVETMSLTQPVADFYEVLGPFYEFVAADKKKANGQINGNANIIAEEPYITSTPINSKPITNGDIGGINGDAPILTNGSGTTNGSVHDNESDTEEFSDTYDHITDDSNGSLVQTTRNDEIISARGESELSPPRFPAGNMSNRPTSSRQATYRGVAGGGGGQHLGAIGAAGGSGGGQGQYTGRELSDVNEQIAVAVLRLQQSMDSVNSRIESIENHLRNSSASGSSRSLNKSSSSWWPFPELSPSTAAFLVLWPFIAQLLINKIRERRNT